MNINDRIYHLKEILNHRKYWAINWPGEDTISAQRQRESHQKNIELLTADPVGNLDKLQIDGDVLSRIADTIHEYLQEGKLINVAWLWFTSDCLQMRTYLNVFYGDAFVKQLDKVTEENQKEFKRYPALKRAMRGKKQREIVLLNMLARMEREDEYQIHENSVKKSYENIKNGRPPGENTTCLSWCICRS